MHREGWFRKRDAVLAALVAVALASCGGGGGSDDTGAPPPPTTQTAAAAAGKAIFFDTSLSASGKQSCGTCHVPSRAFTANPATDHGLPVPIGGTNMDMTGFRKH